MKRIFLIVAVLIVLLTIAQETKILPPVKLPFSLPEVRAPEITVPPLEVVKEESVITKVVEEALPSVVTVSITRPGATQEFQFDPSNPFNPLVPLPREAEEERNIGSGFVIDPQGLVITNKHVVASTSLTYHVVTNDGKNYEVQEIYRDPLNDVAILKINASGLKPLRLGDSSNLKLGQLAIAIGTPLGEFTNTVTVGIISGLGRGITAGSPFEGYVEKLDNVIQTDAAISPGNSGGPLLNSQGEVIGINTAIASEGQNLGFALPANIIKDLITTFERNGGSFERPYIGVRYQIIDTETAAQNKIVPGAYIREVIPGSPAAKADLQDEDIIVQIDGAEIKGDDDQALTRMIIQKKIGEAVRLRIWRGGKTFERNLTLEAAP